MPPAGRPALTHTPHHSKSKPLTPKTPIVLVEASNSVDVQLLGNQWFSGAKRAGFGGPPARAQMSHNTYEYMRHFFFHHH